jgi:hypothetical protein
MRSLLLLLVLAMTPSSLAVASSPEVERVRKRIAKKKYTGYFGAIGLGERLLKKKKLPRYARAPLLSALGEAYYLSLKEEPDAVRLQLFVNRFSSHPRISDAREIQASLALQDAIKVDTVAAIIGVRQTYPTTRAGRVARTQAADLGQQRLPHEANADTLRTYALRHKGTAQSGQANHREDAVAFTATESRDSTGAWQRFIDRYPDHPRIDDAIAQLHQESFADLESEGASSADLWAYAARFPATEQGWKAGQDALAESLQWGWEPIGPLWSLTADLGGTLPSGWSADLKIMIKSGETSIEWGDAIATWAPLTGGIQPPSKAHRTEMVRSGKEVRWRTQYPVCSTDGKPVSVGADLRVSNGTKTTHWQKLFEVSAPCAGAQRMVFGALGDDVVGPLALLRFDPIKKRYTRDKATWTVKDEMDCSQVSEVSSAGVSLICGYANVRVGWKPGDVWLRPTDTQQATTTRVVLEPPSIDKRLGIRDLSRRAAPRDALVTPVDLPSSFGIPTQESLPAVPTITARELVHSRSQHPIPAGSQARPLQMTSTGSPDRNRLLPAVHAVFGKQASMPSTISINDDAQLYILVSPDIRGQERPIGVLGQSKSGSEAWLRHFPIGESVSTSRADWTAFTHEGRPYVRATGVSPVRGRRVRLVTFFVHAGEIHMDIQDLR